MNYENEDLNWRGQIRKWRKNKLSFLEVIWRGNFGLKIEIMWRFNLEDKIIGNGDEKKWRQKIFRWNFVEDRFWNTSRKIICFQDIWLKFCKWSKYGQFEFKILFLIIFISANNIEFFKTSFFYWSLSEIFCCLQSLLFKYEKLVSKSMNSRIFFYSMPKASRRESVFSTCLACCI